MGGQLKRIGKKLSCWKPRSLTWPVDFCEILIITMAITIVMKVYFLCLGLMIVTTTAFRTPEIKKVNGFVNGCRSQAECADPNCCIFDWIPGVETEIGLCVGPAPSGGVCSPACRHPSCFPGLACLPDPEDAAGKVHLCQWLNSWQLWFKKNMWERQ